MFGQPILLIFQWQRGFMYLMAVVDLYSRKVLQLVRLNTMDAEWCTGALKQTIAMHGTPEIFNTMGTPSARKPIY
jgi:transposase InsO family protein